MEKLQISLDVRDRFRLSLLFDGELCIQLEGEETSYIRIRATREQFAEIAKSLSYPFASRTSSREVQESREEDPAEQKEKPKRKKEEVLAFISRLEGQLYPRMISPRETYFQDSAGEGYLCRFPFDTPKEGALGKRVAIGGTLLCEVDDNGKRGEKYIRVDDLKVLEEEEEVVGK